MAITTNDAAHETVHETAQDVLAGCRSMSDIHIEIEERIKRLRELALDVGDVEDAADCAENLTQLLRALAA